LSVFAVGFSQRTNGRAKVLPCALRQISSSAAGPAGILRLRIFDSLDHQAEHFGVSFGQPTQVWECIVVGVGRQSAHRGAQAIHWHRSRVRILEVTEVKTVPYVPISHPFVARLTGTMIRREFLDQVTFWGAPSLQRKLLLSDEYYNRDSGRRGLEGSIPDPKPANTDQNIARLNTTMEILLPWFVSAASSGLHSDSHPTR